MQEGLDGAEGVYRMLVADDRAAMRDLLEGAFSSRGFEVATASSGEEALSQLGGRPFHVVITDLNMPGKGGLDVLRGVKASSPDTKVIIITAFGSIETAVEAMRLGAEDFITKPFKLSEVEHKVDRIIQKFDRAGTQKIQTWIHPGVRHFVGTSEHTRQLMKMIARVAPSNSSVLITGPSGVGKELVAHAIHEASPRRDRPFIALNCAALAPSILESELFGHEKGAFTGADVRRPGRFERAHTGTLFLDEVGEIDPSIQVKLLRVLQEGEVERVGGTQTIPVNVRVVAATNRDLKEAIAQGRFREDFYYRLNVVSLDVMPLSGRRDDIPLLIDHFLHKFSLEFGKEVYEVDDAVVGAFLNYSWPGNVRELENIIERAVLLTEGDRITLSELPAEMLSLKEDPLVDPELEDAGAPLMDRTGRLERDLILGSLEEFHWNKSKAADHLGLKRTTLQYKIRKYGLE